MPASSRPRGTYENRLVETFILNPRWECDKAVAELTAQLINEADATSAGFSGLVVAVAPIMVMW